MTNIIALITPKRVFRDSRRVISDPFKGAGNDNEVKVRTRRVRVEGSSRSYLLDDVICHGVQFSVLELKIPR